MAAAADSAATVASQAECDVDGKGYGTSGHFPVFDAFDGLGLTGRDVAELVGVSPPTVSKWRKAKVRIPGDKLAFLTLVLAHIIDEVSMVMEANADQGPIEAARAALAYQDVLNQDLAASDVYAGAQRFRNWWTSGKAQHLHIKRFSPLDSADVLKVLKKMGTRS